MRNSSAGDLSGTGEYTPLVLDLAVPPTRDLRSILVTRDERIKHVGGRRVLQRRKLMDGVLGEEKNSYQTDLSLR